MLIFFYFCDYSQWTKVLGRFFYETKYDDANIRIAMQERTCNGADVADQARLACIATFG